MLPFINEENTLLADTGVPVSGIFASDEFVRGQQFHGFTVQAYSELLALREKVIVLIAFASELPDVMERFYKLASIHETYAPHVPVFSGEETVTPAWIKKHETKLLAVYERLADAVSRETFASVLNYKLSGKLSYLQACTTNRTEDLRTIFSFGGEETYLDLGAYNGDTVQEFLQLTRGRYKKIVALEPDPKNFKKLTDFVRQNELKKITCLQAGVWNDCGSLELTGNGGRQSTFWEADRSGFATQPLSQTCSMKKKIKKQQVNVVSVDAVLGNEHADYMKFDVEGVEKEALEGAAGHLIPDGNGSCWSRPTTMTKIFLLYPCCCGNCSRNIKSICESIPMCLPGKLIFLQNNQHILRFYGKIKEKSVAL